jgi:hypothetical protein
MDDATRTRNRPIEAVAPSVWITIVALVFSLGGTACLSNRAEALAAQPAQPRGDEQKNATRDPSRNDITVGDLRQKIEVLEHDVDVIQNKLIKSDGPFYSSSSFWISIAALVFSIGTTVWSSIKADAQAVQASRQELRGLLQRLAALPKESLEAAQKYANDPYTSNPIGSLSAQENSLLARQAADIARKLPPDLISPTEYYAIAMALQNAYDYNSTRDLLERSIATAHHRSDFVSEISAMRALGYLDFVVGKPDEGRSVYRDALTIFTRYPDFDQYTQTNTHFLTQLNWASAETIARSPEAVRQHLDAADALLRVLPPSPGLDNMRHQLDQATTRFGEMGVIAKATTGAAMPMSAAVAPPVPNFAPR